MEEAGISPADLNLVGSFDEQVNNILENVRLSWQEVNSLQLLHDHLSATLETIWPGCKVLLFGSIATGLGMKTSDVDCFIKVHPHVLNYGGPRLVLLARNQLRKQPQIFSEPFAITSARVPIVKFSHLPTGRNCDINFTSPSGFRNSELVAFLLSYDNSYLTLAIIIKYWSKIQKLTGTNLVSSYSLTLMVIYYLQQLHLLPSVRELQNGCEADDNLVENWNTSFNSMNPQTNEYSCHRSLYNLIGGFFKFYSTFDFDSNIISPYTGGVIPRKNFSSLDSVPSIFNTYKFNVRSQICQPIQLKTKLCLQDPFEHNTNTMRGVFPRLAATFLAHIQFAANIYDESKVDNFILDILTKTPPNLGNENKKKDNKKPKYIYNMHRVIEGKINKYTRKGKNKNAKNSLSALYRQINIHKRKFH